MNKQNLSLNQASSLLISELLKEIRAKKPDKIYEIDLFNTGFKLNSEKIKNMFLLTLEKYVEKNGVRRQSKSVRD